MNALHKFVYGDYSFDTIGPGFVCFRINTDNSTVREFLQELKLTVPKTQKRYRTTWAWEPDFEEFLNEHGYFSSVDIVSMLRNTGLIMKTDRAIAFRLRFL